MTTPGAVLELREQIIAHWFKVSGDLVGDPDPHIDELGRMGGAAVATLMQAECFYWADWTCDALASAGPHLPLTWTLEAPLIPAVKGFWYFEKPLPLPGDRLAEGLRAIAWTPITVGNVAGEEEEQWIARVTGNGVAVGDDNHVLVCFFGDFPDQQLPVPITAYQLPCGETIAQVHQRIGAHKGQADDMRRARGLAKLRYFGAGLSFLDQRIVQSHRERPDRHTARRLARIRDEVPDIHVVRLRRTIPLDQSPTLASVAWACQWIVRGHWRQAWLPSARKHRPIWIRPHVKGPADKPLKVAEDRIFAVVR